MTTLPPVERLAALEAYRTPKPPGDIDLWLAGNEGLAPDAGLYEQLPQAGPELMRRYPQAGTLEARLAAGNGITPEQVVVTAGADDALLRCCLATLEPGRTLLLPSPSFEMLPRYAQIAGGTVREVAWPTEAFPVDEVCQAITPQTAAIALVTPNNPTGAVLSEAQLRQVADAAPQAVLIVDLAYVEFADEDLTSVALSLPNAIVTRTFSKAWGLAGLRVGYALGSADWIERLRSVGNPYAVSGPSLCLAEAALEQDASPYLSAVRRERVALYELLNRHGLRAVQSQGNFVLARMANPQQLWERLAARGIAIRWFGQRPGLTDAVRITCPGDEAMFARLTQALEEALSQGAA